MISCKVGGGSEISPRRLMTCKPHRHKATQLQDERAGPPPAPCTLTAFRGGPSGGALLGGTLRAARTVSTLQESAPPYQLRSRPPALCASILPAPYVPAECLPPCQDGMCRSTKPAWHGRVPEGISTVPSSSPSTIPCLLPPLPWSPPRPSVPCLSPPRVSHRLRTCHPRYHAWSLTTACHTSHFIS